jgi:hypothetical protein
VGGITPVDDGGLRFLRSRKLPDETDKWFLINFFLPPSETPSPSSQNFKSKTENLKLIRLTNRTDTRF